MSNPVAQPIPRTRFPEKLGFCTFSTASNVVYQFKSIYYLFFLTNVLKIDVLIAGTILTFGTIWDAINDPLIGFWAVNHKFKNGERVRPLAIWFAVPWAITVVLLFTNFGLQNKAAVAVALIVYLLFELFNTFVGIPYNSMGSLATNLDADRRSINVFRNLGGALGAGIGAVACLPLLKAFGAMDGKGNLIDSASSRGFLLTACVMGVVCVIGCVVHYFTTKERVKPIAEDDEKLSAKTVFSMLFRCKSWVLNMLYIICYGVINLLLMSCITYYATYVIGSTAAATAIQAAYLAAALVSSFLVSAIDRLLGRKKTMLLAAALFILGKVWFVINPFSLGAIYVNAISVGIALTITFVMFNTNRNNIVDIIEWQSGRRLDSLVSTADNLASKLAVAGATQLVALSLSLNGFNAKLTAQPAGAIAAINAILGWIPMVVAAVMMVVIFFLNIENDTKKMLEEKAAQA
ncbi:MAG TPA: glycoside-pentoside-hexuronide (GPH):cation symporter [Clostridia bacterium]|nr:glycoside-pentoside-hexuronide (GPH):cation symporter [Clostridia bacterium]